MAKTPSSQCRGPRFNPCLGNKTPHAATKTWHHQRKKGKTEGHHLELGVQDREDVGRERRAPKVGEQTFKNPTLYNRSKFSRNVLKSLLKSKQIER